MVPGGQPITLKLGLAGYITQALGGSFTLYVEGNLYRLAGDQADAIGKEVVRPPKLPPNATEADVRELAWQQMRSCFDPEIPINIVDLGLVYDCEVSAGADQHARYPCHDDAHGAGLRHGRCAGAGRQEKLESIPTVGRVEVIADLRSAVEPVHDVGGRAPANRHDLVASAEAHEAAAAVAARTCRRGPRRIGGYRSAVELGAAAPRRSMRPSASPWRRSGAITCS